MRPAGRPDSVARDHFGIKPLYYADAGSPEHPRLLFASEIPALLATGHVQRRVNERVLYRYLQFRIHDDSDETFFDGVHRLLPGEKLVLDHASHRWEVSSYTRLREELAQLSTVEEPYNAAAVAEYDRRFTEAVRLRLQADGPVGAGLSGGLDSSAVVVTIDRLRREQTAAADSVGASQQTFSAVFPRARNDEETYADAVVDRFRDSVTGHKTYPRPEQFAAELDDFVRTMEQPVISSGPYAQFCVMRDASRHVIVLLDGQGADEAMAGYVPYYVVYLRQLRARGEFIKLVREAASCADVLLPLARSRVRGRLRTKKPLTMASLLQPGFRHRFAGERFAAVKDNVKLRLIDDLFRSSLPSLLRYEDRTTTRFSLEGRAPFLDKELVKYLFSLSDEAIIKGGWNKRILRDALRGLLPGLIRGRRNKIGFTTPEADWFQQMKADIDRIFRSDSFARRPYWDQDAV